MSRFPQSLALSIKKKTFSASLNENTICNDLSYQCVSSRNPIPFFEFDKRLQSFHGYVCTDSSRESRVCIYVSFEFRSRPITSSKILLSGLSIW